jgi:hypothetical protein
MDSALRYYARSPQLVNFLCLMVIQSEIVAASVWAIDAEKLLRWHSSTSLPCTFHRVSWV